MTGRSLDAGFATALQAAHVTGFVLVEMRLDSGTQYLAGLAHAVTWNGQTWLPVQGLGTVQEIVETDAEVRGLEFTLSGVPESAIAGALAEAVQGRVVIVRQAVLDDAGNVLVDANVWQGYLDLMTVDDSGPAAVIHVTAEHVMSDWADPNLSRYSHEDQQRFQPGDRFFEYAAQMANATVVWPNKSFFRQ